MFSNKNKKLLKSEMVELKEQFSILYDDYITLYNKHNRLQTLNELVSKFVSTKSARNNKLVSSINTLHNAFTKINAKLRSEEDDLNRLLQQKDNVRATLNDALKENTRLLDLNNILYIKNEDFKSKTDELILLSDELKYQVESLQKKKCRFEADIGRMLFKKNIINIEVDKIESERSNQLSKMKKTNKTINSLNEELLEKQQQVAYLKKECNRLSVGNKLINEADKRYDKDVEELHIEIDNLTNKKHNLNRQTIKLDSHLETMRQIKMKKLEEIVFLTKGIKEGLLVLENTMHYKC